MLAKAFERSRRLDVTIAVGITASADAKSVEVPIVRLASTICPQEPLMTAAPTAQNASKPTEVSATARNKAEIAFFARQQPALNSARPRRSSRTATPPIIHRAICIPAPSLMGLV